MEKLKETSRGNFVLTEGGLVLDTTEREKVSNLTDELFDTLIESNVPEEARDPALDEVIDNTIRELRLKENRSFHSKYEISCRVAPNVSERFEFSHAYANGTLKRLYQRVPLARKPASLRRTVHDSAWMFEKVVQEGIVQREDAIALVFATDERRADPEVVRSLDVLASVARVANLADQTEALLAFVVE
jgi:hypothetical protein